MSCENVSDIYTFTKEIHMRGCKTTIFIWTISKENFLKTLLKRGNINKQKLLCGNSYVFKINKHKLQNWQRKPPLTQAFLPLQEADKLGKDIHHDRV